MIYCKSSGFNPNFTVLLSDCFLFKNRLIFPEISIEKVKNITGMNITFVTTASNDEEGYELLKSFGMPFASKK